MSNSNFFTYTTSSLSTHLQNKTFISQRIVRFLPLAIFIVEMKVLFPRCSLGPTKTSSPTASVRTSTSASLLTSCVSSVSACCFTNTRAQTSNLQSHPMQVWFLNHKLYFTGLWVGALWLILGRFIHRRRDRLNCSWGGLSCCLRCLSSSSGLAGWWGWGRRICGALSALWSL